MKTTITLTAGLVALGLSLPSLAQVPEHIPVQGYLQDIDGSPVDGSVRFTVALYDSPTGGAPLYTELQTLSVDDGRFIVPVGEVTPFPWIELARNPRLYFGLSIDDDAELRPRFELGVVPYASMAVSAQNLRGAAPEDFATVDHVHAWSEIGGVPASLADGDDDALGALSCAAGEILTATPGGWGCGTDSAGLMVVGPGDISNGAVATNALADGAVTGVKVQDRSLTGQDIAFDSITSRQVAANTLTASELAPNSVSTSEIASGAVTGSKLSLSLNEYCVLGSSASRRVSGRRFCGISRVPSNVRCEIDVVGGDFLLIETPSGPNSCCMRCF